MPDKKGKLHKPEFIKLSEAKEGRSYILTGVADHSTAFLKFLDKNGFKIGGQIKIIEIESFDGSVIIEYNKTQHRLSLQVGSNLLVK
ncbi:MAG: FeoA family protein [Flavobacteriales bacterium]